MASAVRRPRSAPPTTASTMRTRARAMAPRAPSAAAQRSRRNAATSSAASSSPTAPWCPPQRARAPAAWPTRACRSTPGRLRPEPLARPVAGSREMTTAGRPKRSTSLAATIPTTPSCHPSPAATMAPASSSSGVPASTTATASSTMRRSTSRRSWLSAHSSAAGGSASAASAASSSDSARSGWAMRPAALTHGASVNPRVRAVTARGGTPACRHRAATPGRGADRIAARPRATRRRFSPVSGTASATVASATRSSASSGAGASRPASSRAASATVSFHTTPAAAGSGPSGRPRAGLARMAGGRAPAARWWSQTMASMPSSTARVRGSTAVVPQSTQTSTRHPSSARRSTVASETP